MKLQDFYTIAGSLLERMLRASNAPGNLRECSPWMSNFRVEFLRAELEVPGEFTCVWTARRWGESCQSKSLCL